VAGRAAAGAAEHLGDDAHQVFFAHDEEFLALDLDRLARVLAEQDLVTDLDVERNDLAVVVALARSNRDDLALVGLLAALSGMTMPDAVLRSWSRRLTITRSCKGRIFIQSPSS